MQNAAERSAIVLVTPLAPRRQQAMCINLINAVCPEQKFVLSQLPASIGRQPRAVVRLDDRQVSQFQCVIDAPEGVPTVLDLGSIFGTYVNGVRRAMSQLLDGDHLTVGGTDFVVKIG